MGVEEIRRHQTMSAQDQATEAAREESMKQGNDKLLFAQNDANQLNELYETFESEFVADQGIDLIGRVKFLYNWMLTEMGADSENEWIVIQMLYAPCMFKILINNRVSFVVVHTDDCDGASQDPQDGAAIRDAFNTRFGVKDVDLNFMLGNQRDVYQVDGAGNVLSDPTPESTTVLRHHQTGYVDKLWEHWGISENENQHHRLRFLSRAIFL